jgi:hypothetical protein
MEQNNPNSLRLVQLNEISAKILLAILDNESEELTIPKLSNLVGQPVNKFIEEVEEDDRQFLAFSKWSSGKSLPKNKDKGSGGKPTEILEIKPDKIVTNPLSAIILIELAKVSKQNREINKDYFISNLIKSLDYLSKSYKDFTQEITERINFLIKIGDICYDDSVPSVIWIHWIRYHSQKAYLNLLVAKLPKPAS